MKRKTTKITLSLSILLLAVAMFVGCGGILSPVIEEPSAAETPVGGIENVPAGKILVVANLDSMESSSRAAVPSAMSSIANFSYFGRLKISDTDNSAAFKKGTLSDSKLTFEFDAPSQTEGLILEIVAYPNATLTDKPDSTPALSVTKPSLSVANNTITISDKLTLKPNTSSGTTGAVNLSITLPTGYSLEVKTTPNGEFSCSQSGTTVTVAKTDAPAGSYTFAFLVKNSSGNIVYGWTETIVVYAGMETDAWLSATGTTSTDAKAVSPETITNTAAAQTTFYVRGSGNGWYTSTFTENTPVGNDSNPGTLMKPLAKVQDAIDKVTAAKDGSSQYTIYVDGEFTADWTDADTPVANIAAGSSSLTLSIIGLGTDSQKATFNGDNKIYNVVKGSGANLVLNLENLKITGGDGNIGWAAKKGGGVLAQDGIYTLKNCEIIGNKARSGGGVALLGKSLTLSGCVVNKNNSSYGGGISIYSYGSKDDTTSPYPVLTLKDNTIVGNKNLSSLSTTSDDYGNSTTDHSAGILAATDNNNALKPAKIIIESGCYVIGNHSTNKAGGIFLENTGTLEINEGAFVKYNHAPNGNGGGILVSPASGYPAPSVTISGSVIGNKASDNGGGIANEGGTLTLSGAEFYDNTADFSGGAIFNSGTLEISSGTKIGAVGNENLSGFGGGIYNSGTITMTGGVIDNNYAENEGGGIYNDEGTVNLSGESAITGNEAEAGGAGLYNHGGQVSISGKVHIEKNVVTNAKGGGIFNECGTDIGKVSIDGTDILISENQAKDAYAEGGGIYNESGATVEIKAGVTINKNSAQFGGGISNHGSLNISGGTIGGESDSDKNTADYNGGGIYAEGTVTITNGKISHNQANGSTGKGGGIFIGDDSSVVTISGGIISDNLSTAGGTGIYIHKGTLNLKTDAQIGGDIFLSKGKNITITGSLTNSTVATITPEKYPGETDYTDAAVLTAGTGVNLSNEVGKFKVTPSSSKQWKVDTDGKLAEDVNIHTLTVAQVISGALNDGSITAGKVIIEGAVTNENIAALTYEIYICSNGVNGNNIEISLIMDASSSIEEIGQISNGYELCNAFYECSRLFSITIPKSVKRITAGQFSTCTKLSSINFVAPNGWCATSNSDFSGGSPVPITVVADDNEGTNATYFKSTDIYWYRDDTTVIHEVDIKNVKDFLEDAANFTSGEVNIKVAIMVDDDWDTIRKAIDNAEGNVNLTLSEKCEVTEIIYGEFQDCEKLKSIKILPSKIDTICENAFSALSNFSSCGLCSVILSENIKTIEDSAFYYCENLTTVTIPSNSNLTTIGDSAFESCFALSSINLPNLLVSIGNMAFYDTTSLKSITIPKSVEKIGNQLFLCSSSDGKVSKLEEVVFEDIFGWYATIDDGYKDGTLILDLSYPSTNAANFLATSQKTADWSNMYLYRKTDLVFAEDAADTIKNATGRVEVPVVITEDSDFTKIKTALQEASSTAEINLVITQISPNITEISGNIFTSNKKIKSVTIPEGITTIKDSAFGYCENLSSVVLPSTLTTINKNVFAGTALTSIVLPENLGMISNTAFKECENLTSIRIPSSVVQIGSEVFKGCTNLSSIIFDSPTGWYYTDNYLDFYYQQNGTAVSTDLSNVTTATTYLKGLNSETYLFK